MPLFDYIKSDKNETRVKKFLIKNCEAEIIFFKTIDFFPFHIKSRINLNMRAMTDNQTIDTGTLSFLNFLKR